MTTSIMPESGADLVPPERLPYMRGIDGLRAIAVMAVLFYHADFAWARGGFLGVEVFFVISGYLITSLLLAEWLRTGTIGLKAFWIRRARRLLPAVFLLLFVTSAASLLIYRDTLDRMLGDVVAASGYVTNWFLIANDVSYFETFGRPPLLQHLWSLSVEEQFYVLWPIIFTFGMALFRSKRPDRTIRSFLVLTIGGIVASTALMVIRFVPFEDPSRVYYGTDTRAAGILVGVALALVWIPWRLPATIGRGARRAFTATGVGALIGLLAILVTMDEFSTFLYRGGFLVTSVVTAAVIAVTVHPALGFGRALEQPVLKWIGTRSYGIYLWHWPIFMVTRPGIDVGTDTVVSFLGRTALTFAAAELSYRYVEAPIRRLGFRRWVSNLRRSAGISTVRGGSIVAAGALAGVAVLMGGLVWGSMIRERPVTLASEAVSDLDGIVVASMGDGDAITRSTPTSEASSSTTVVSDELVDAEDGPVAVSEPLPEPGPTASTTSTTTTVPQPAPAPLAEPDATDLVEPAAVPTVTIIGDSVLAGAQLALEDTIVNPLVVDATVSRQFKFADDVARDLRSAGELGDIVVIHLGTNGAFSAETFDAVMAELSDVDRVIVVNAKVPRRWESTVNRTIAEGAQRWPSVEVVDWHTIASGHPEWFNDDLVHLNSIGTGAYAHLIASIIDE